MKTDKKALVFVLDDETALTDLIETALTQGGRIEVKAFNDTQSLIEDAALVNVDLFIIDVNLKGASGFDVPAALPEQCRFAAFLFISGYNLDAELYDRSKALSLFDFIAKPFSIGQLKERVNSLLSDRLQLPTDIDGHLLSMWQKDAFLAILIGPDKVIRLANDKMARMIGMDTPRDLVGKSFARFLPAYCLDQVNAMVDGIIAGDDNAPNEIETEIIAAGGRLHRVMWFCSSFEGEDTNRLVLAVGVLCGNRRRKRIRNVYRQLLVKDRAAIRSIKPLKVPDYQT